MLLGLNKVHLAIAGTVLLDDVDFSLDERERVCLVGRNGAGKSTLLKVMSGELAIDSGEIVRASGLKLARMQQDVPTAEAGSVYDVVAAGVGELGAVVSQYHALSCQEHPDMKQLDALHARIDAADGWALESRVQAMITRLRLPPDGQFADLSGGLKRRVLLAQALVGDPDVLLLDEPTNHLDIDSIAEMEELLASYSGALIFISHDRAFVRRLATRVCDLDRGQLSSWPGGWEAYLKGKEEALHAEDRQRALFDKKLAQEEVWIRKGVEARRTRNAGRVKALMALREQFRQRRNREGQVQIAVQEAERSGKLVAELKNVAQAYQGRTLIRDLSTVILRGDKLGIIGPNGAGKTTLLNIILGRLQPDSGDVRQGSKLEIAYFDQLRGALLNLDQTAVDAVGGGKEFVEIGNARKHVIGYLQDFLFTPDRARVPVRVLSGGERSRLLLAQLFCKPSNLLVLDEPTNDLDMETLDLLEERLIEYQGTVLLVSHDREFLNNVVTRSLVFEGNGKVGDYVGGYDDWLRQRRAAPRREAPAAAAPKATAATQPAAPSIVFGTAMNTKQRRELDALPKKIETLEAEQTALSEQMAAADFYQQPREAITAVENRLATLAENLAALYARWEELEALR